MEKPKIKLNVWIADLTYTQQTIAADVMPNAIGGIATFCDSILDLQQPIRLFKYPEKLIKALETDGIPDVIGFSNYVWNSQLAYGISKVLKTLKKKPIIIFGGPDFPVDHENQLDWFSKHPEIDFYIVKEAELAFSKLLKELDNSNLDVEAVKQKRIPSVQAIHKSGEVCFSDSIERIKDLSQIPSPYSTGVLDEFFDGKLLPIIQTNRGCPFSCTFCVEGITYFNKIYRSSSNKVSEELHYIAKKMEILRAQGGRNDLFIADSNFGMYKEDIDTCHVIAAVQKHNGWPEYINVATGKNQKERVLKASKIINGSLRLSGSVQSLDKDVLDNIKRKNIVVDDLMDLALQASEVGANSYSEIILGLPGDTKEKHFKTVKTVMEAGFTNIYLFQLMLLPGTQMCTPQEKIEYQMNLKYRVLPRCYGVYSLFDQTVSVAEIEQICVSTKDLTFNDYIDCRKMHLIVTIFYNDGIFQGLLKLLRSLNISTWEWIELMTKAIPPQPLSDLFQGFKLETENELWSNKEELQTFINDPNNCKKFINGELGNNLLFIHKTRAITSLVDSLCQMVLDVTHKLLSQHNFENSHFIYQFVEELVSFQKLRMSNIFTSRDTNPTGAFEYDIEKFEAEEELAPLDTYKFSYQKELSFKLSEEQKSLINRYIGIYGETEVGIGRIVSKVYVRKLFRSPQNALNMQLNEKQLEISGLQN